MQGFFKFDQQRESLSREAYDAITPKLKEYEKIIEKGDKKLSTRLEYYSMKMLHDGSMDEFNLEERQDFEQMSRYLKDIKINESTNLLNPEYVIQLPLNGEYFENSASQTNASTHKYGDYATIMTIVNAMEKWDKESTYPLRINDLSLLGGAPSTYHHNRSHLGVDVNLTGKNGQPVRYYWNSNYDREATARAIEILMDSAPNGYEVSKVLYNDQEVRNQFYNRKNSYNRQIVRPANGHDHHYHVEVRPIKIIH